MTKKNIKKRYEENPSEVLTEELLDVISKTKNPALKFDAIKMLAQLSDDHIC